MNTLTAADIETLRREFLGDVVDLHPEFGASPVVAASASAGAGSISLSSLQGPSRRRGTPFYILTATSRDRYTVDEAVDVTAGAATVKISPVLGSALAGAEEIEPEAYYRSLYNLRTRRQAWTDTDLQDLALRAQQRWGRRIESSNQRQELLFRAVRLMAAEQIFAMGSDFVAVVLGDDQGGVKGKAFLDIIRETQKEDRGYLETEATGARSMFLCK